VNEVPVRNHPPVPRGTCPLRFGRKACTLPRRDCHAGSLLQ
jgi:hypothetical protein